ncbi:site-specific DNA-methyltransferase [Clostridioides sp. ZZV14-6150]|uniref:DNA-methyltransferase n=1 Tax=Clostridioides sp. ZZV14-6150 TaxID=2811493 RepID=UPI001D0FB5A9|nr:site-specific DNA-methyltransferase [Clostridioides sp. ZZV14-6150]
MDCIEYIKTMPNGCIDLIIADAPYYSTKIESVGDKQFKNEKEYINWLIELLYEFQRILKNNGSLYLFHNDTNIMIDVLYKFKYESNLVLQNEIVWSKINTHNNFSRIIKTYGSNRRYGKTFTEYIYYFTFEDKTGLSKIMLDTNNFRSLRDYFERIQRELKLNKKNILTKIGSRADHCFRWKSSQWDLPTEETYNDLIKIFNIDKFIFFREYKDLKQEYNNLRNEYESLRQEYESNRYLFNQPYMNFKGTNIQQQKSMIRPYTNIWEYSKDDIKINHMTPKPVDMIKHIIKTSSNEGDLVYIPFAGSGSDIVACIETNRKYIATETNKQYIEKIIFPRIKNLKERV